MVWSCRPRFFQPLQVVQDRASWVQTLIPFSNWLRTIIIQYVLLELAILFN